MQVWFASVFSPSSAASGSPCDETQKLKWSHIKNSICYRLKNSDCDKTKNSNCDQTQKLKLWQKLNCDKTQVVIKLKLWQKSSCDKNRIVTKIELWRKKEKKKNSKEKKLLNGLLVKTFWHLDNRWAAYDFCDVFFNPSLGLFWGL